MSTTVIERPAASEHAEYYGRYLSQVPDGDVLEMLRAGPAALEALLGGLDDAKALHRYAPGKWSIKEVLSHMIDVERIFAYRALRIARGDRTPMPGFEQDDYVTIAGADRRPLAGLLAEYRHLRAANLEMIAGFGPEALTREGMASGYRFTTRALVWIIAGHERHHLNGLRRDYL